MITLPKTVSERLDLSFGIFARRGEKYSCYTSVLKFVPPAGGVCGAATHAVRGNAGYGLLDVIKTADYIVNLGPEGGDGRGRIIASGSPEEVVKVKGSYTGKYLKVVL